MRLVHLLPFFKGIGKRIINEIKMLKLFAKLLIVLRHTPLYKLKETKFKM